jgi:hypothetical protein
MNKIMINFFNILININMEKMNIPLAFISVIIAWNFSVPIITTVVSVVGVATISKFLFSSYVRYLKSNSKNKDSKNKDLKNIDIIVNYICIVCLYAERISDIVVEQFMKLGNKEFDVRETPSQLYNLLKIPDISWKSNQKIVDITS